MPRDRRTAAVVYGCGLMTVGIVLGLMGYLGVFDGLGDALFEMAKDVAKFFWTD